MNRIDATFARLKSEGRTALIPYVMTGDPSLRATPLAVAVAAALALPAACQCTMGRDAFPALVALNY